MQCELKMESGIRSQVIWPPRNKGKEKEGCPSKLILGLFASLGGLTLRSNTKKSHVLGFFNTEIFGADMRVWKTG